MIISPEEFLPFSQVVKNKISLQKYSYTLRPITGGFLSILDASQIHSLEQFNTLLAEYIRKHNRTFHTGIREAPIWPERSLCYLCRSFDNLNRGDEYTNVCPTVQIGILDFTLFPENPEFYATYQLLNIKNHKLYSDKLRISVLQLNQISIATEEDKSYQLDCWAKFFKVSTVVSSNL